MNTVNKKRPIVLSVVLVAVASVCYLQRLEIAAAWHRWMNAPTPLIVTDGLGRLFLHMLSSLSSLAWTLAMIAFAIWMVVRMVRDEEDN